MYKEEQRGREPHNYTVIFCELLLEVRILARRCRGFFWARTCLGILILSGSFVGIQKQNGEPFELLLFWYNNWHNIKYIGLIYSGWGQQGMNLGDRDGR